MLLEYGVAKEAAEKSTQISPAATSNASLRHPDQRHNRAGNPPIWRLVSLLYQSLNCVGATTDLDDHYDYAMAL